MSNRAVVYDLLLKYVTSDDHAIKEKIVTKLNNMRKKNTSHVLNEHDEYFYYKYMDKSNDEKDWFELSNNQKFLKQFMSTNTKNRALLLYHGVGVGKTCASIHISQNFKGKTIVITSSLLKSNFKKELFDKSKINDLDNTCIGDYYTKNYEKLSKKDINNEVQALIKEDYEFYGYLEFSNEIERNNKEGYIQYLNNRFHNKLLIVDEVHNIRIDKSDELTKLPGILKDIYKFVPTVRLLFLSATPMYNEAEEILWIMDVFTDIVEKYDSKIDLFDPSFKKDLVEFANHHVSFMRGENPITFPVRLFPSINKDKNVLTRYPTVDVYNKKIEDMNMIGLELIASYFQKDHLEAYLAIPYKQATNAKTKKANSDMTIEQEYESIDIQKRIQLSIVYYPNGSVGKTGLKSIYSIISGDKHMSFELKKDKPDIFNDKNLATFSPKIRTIMNYVNSSEGIILIYSKYIYSGLIPVALALESQGYNRYGAPNIRSELSKKKANGRGNYIMLTGEKLLSKDKDKLIALSKKEENKHGDEIKVILISPVATEGVDFKNVREIHILEPWYNMSQIEQITGRGVRNISHIHLPDEQRNTTIYLHVNMMKDSNMESVDFRMYRTSISKQLEISKIERILKSASIDCNLNKSVNYYPKDFIKKTIVTSQGVIKRNFNIGDKDYTRMCDYEKCGYKCIPVIDGKNKIDLVREDLVAYDIKMYVKRIVRSFNRRESNYFSYDDIKDDFENKDILNLALVMLTNPSNEYTVKDEKGRFLYRSDKYIFVPKSMEDDKLAISYNDYTPRVKAKDILIRNIKPIEDFKTSGSDVMIVEIKAIQSILEKYYDKNIDYFIVYGMVFDKIEKKQHLEFLNELSMFNTVNPIVKNMLIDSGLVEFENDYIKSYIDIYSNNMYIRETQKSKFVKASPIQKEANITRFTNSIKPLPNVLLGYVELTGKKDMASFKIIKHATKQTTSSKIMGTVCSQTSQITNDMMKDYIHRTGVDKSNILGKPKKSDLCVIYEYILRQQKSQFLRPRHFQIYKELNKTLI